MDSPSFDSHSESEAPDQAIRPPVLRASVWLAWGGILATIGIMMFPHRFVGKEPDREPSIVLLEIQSKYLVGASTLVNGAGPSLTKQIGDVFDRGPLRQRLIGVALTAELIGPADAEKKLAGLEAKIDRKEFVPQPDDQQVFPVFHRILKARIDNIDFESAFPEAELQSTRQLLSQRMGWIGRLTLLPKETSDTAARAKLINQARRLMFFVLAFLGLGLFATYCGVILQIVWWIFLFMGRWHSGILSLRGNGIVYAETFAVGMALYLALSFALIWLPLPEIGLLKLMIPQMGGLAAIAWPVIRGIPWRDVRKDIGLNGGEQPWSSPFVGVGAYLSALPLVVVSIGIMFLMMAIASRSSGANESIAAPSHPIVEPILRGSWPIRLQFVFIAVFAAVPEEILFRGFLYRHLREAGLKFGYVFGVAFATLVSSFLFAAIHPQGIFGIPMLMSLAIVFALVREWRGSLVPCMIAHALVNAGTSCLLLSIAD